MAVIISPAPSIKETDCRVKVACIKVILTNFQKNSLSNTVPKIIDACLK